MQYTIIVHEHETKPEWTKKNPKLFNEAISSHIEE